ncbi:MAG: hypothetical protein V3T09_06930 [bacterium]
MFKFPLDFSNYLSIIILSISTIYKISYHTDIFHQMMDMLFYKLRSNVVTIM